MKWGVIISNKKVFECSNCGYQTIKWAGCCPDCSKWNTFEEREISIKNKVKTPIKNRDRKEPVRLKGVEVSRSNRIVTSINEFNRAMGGGIVRDSVTIVSAKPGAGKSTLLLQVADDIAGQGYKVLYASGEESESQLKNRADRLFEVINNNIWVLSDLSMENVLHTTLKIDEDLIIIDSIQTFVSDEYPGSRAGSPVQTMECANKLVKISKGSSRPRAVIMVCQMNKSEELAGLRALEHLVDTVLIIEGENGEELRGLSVLKNRFGSTWERGFFLMSDTGMLSIDNPSQFFMTKREKGDLFPGNVLTVIKE
ncbi:MAG: ATPase domain-containing protein, partial [Candidatus Contubernalis sp.]|nr:ATPase domain-containing protein [Candidatus Contubernalis sp.]